MTQIWYYSVGQRSEIMQKSVDDANGSGLALHIKNTGLAISQVKTQCRAPSTMTKSLNSVLGIGDEHSMIR